MTIRKSHHFRIIRTAYSAALEADRLAEDLPSLAVVLLAGYSAKAFLHLLRRSPAQ